MIELKMTFEALEDLMTPGGVCTPLKCIEGLPPEANLVNVEIIDPGVVLYTFDDGKEELTTGKLGYRGVIEK